MSARSCTNAMQTVLGPSFFQVTEKPAIMKPISKPNKVLAVTPLILIVARYRDGVGRSTKQE